MLQGMVAIQVAGLEGGDDMRNTATWRVFGQWWEQKLTCRGCGYVSTSTQPALTLELSVVDAAVTSVELALSTYFKEELVACGQCPSDARKVNNARSCPPATPFDPLLAHGDRIT
jgi:hypothetical protein